MSNKTLPPELVEKMRKAMNEMCTPSDLAKISVEHAHKYKERLKVEMDFSVDFQKQRDELLEFVREVMETTTDKIRYDKSKQLLKKIEDGKE